MGKGHPIWAGLLAIGIVLAGVIAARSPAASQEAATPTVPGATLTATVASVSFESFDGVNRVAFAVYRPNDPTAAHVLFQTLSAAGQESGRREISFPRVGEESIANVSRPEQSTADNPTVVVYARVGAFVFVYRARGENPIELMVWATGFLPFDPADELDDAGSDDITLFLPDLQDMPPGYVAVPGDEGATPSAE